jgi:hypothetical protein
VQIKVQPIDVGTTPWSCIKIALHGTNLAVFSGLEIYFVDRSLWNVSRLERIKITLEVWGIRTRGHIRSTVRLIGLALAVLGAYNLLAIYAGASPILTGYRSLTSAIVIADLGITHFADFVLIAVGGMLAWFV